MRKPIKRREIFRGKLINLYLEKRRFPHGYITDLEVIQHPGAVLIIPFLNKNTVILIRQYRPVIQSYIWELPAGTLHESEKPLACAKRELREEIGYKAAMWKKRGCIYPAPGYTTEKILIYEAHNLERVKADREEDELIIPKTFAQKDVAKLFESGSIIDAKTICALKMAKVI